MPPLSPAVLVSRVLSSARAARAAPPWPSVLAPLLLGAGGAPARGVWRNAFAAAPSVAKRAAGAFARGLRKRVFGALGGRRATRLWCI